jgi:hypothetical protein
MEKKLLEDVNRAYAMIVPISIVAGSLAQGAIGFTKMVEVIGYMVSIVAFSIGAMLEVYIGYKTPKQQLLAAGLGLFCMGCMAAFMSAVLGL